LAVFPFSAFGCGQRLLTRRAVEPDHHGSVLWQRNPETRNAEYSAGVAVHVLSPEGAAANSQGREALGGERERFLPLSPEGAAAGECRPFGARVCSGGLVPGAH